MLDGTDSFTYLCVRHYSITNLHSFTIPEQTEYFYMQSKTHKFHGNLNIYKKKYWLYIFIILMHRLRRSYLCFKFS